MGGDGKGKYISLRGGIVDEGIFVGSFFVDFKYLGDAVFMNTSFQEGRGGLSKRRKGGGACVRLIV